MANSGNSIGRRRENPPTIGRTVIRAGAVYCVIVFGIGFCLGALRVLAIAPRLGEMVAVVLEAPVMLAASWAVSLWCARVFQVPTAFAPRLMMGMVAFALLMALEAGLAIVVFGRPVADFFAQY